MSLHLILVIGAIGWIIGFVFGVLVILRGDFTAECLSCRYLKYQLNKKEKELKLLRPLGIEFSENKKGK